AVPPRRRTPGRRQALGVRTERARPRPGSGGRAGHRASPRPRPRGRGRAPPRATLTGRGATAPPRRAGGAAGLVAAPVAGDHPRAHLRRPRPAAPPAQLGRAGGPCHRRWVAAALLLPPLTPRSRVEAG